MANEVNANLNINLDTTQALASLRSLQSQITKFNSALVSSNSAAIAAQQSMLSTLTSQIGATKQFSTQMVSVESSVSRLGKSIDKNKLSLGEYFRYGVASSKNFGRVFGKEHNQIMELASDRVKRLQTQYVALGSAQNGMTRAMAVRPLNLFNADAAIATQRQQLFNKLLNDGSTSIINFGKNTQWSGRQLMVGFTVPLTIFGGIAGKIFMDLERQVVNFRRVYGDAMTPAGETDKMVEDIQRVAKEFTKYGIAVKDTVGLAADVAAAGGQGDDLIAATAQSTRLATLGMIEMNQAMTATMALQTAFKLSNEELAQSVDFLNAVENQTVLSLDDVTVAIPKVAPIIKGLGGDVQDLAIFLTAMREGGVNAAEGANALKSGLASLINPTKGARDQLEKVGINIDSILSKNKGDIRAIVTEFGSALETLDKFGRQQTLAKVFGKYQFARLGALFENISVEGSQAQRVVDLTGQSFEQLNELAEKELTAIEESIGMKFTGAVERAKLAIAPIGEVFLRVATPIIDGVTKILEKFNELSPGVKQFLAVMVAGLGVVVPAVIMLIGLFANFAGQAIKGASLLNGLFNRIRTGGNAFDYLSEQELDAAAAASSLEGKTNSLTGALNVQRSAVIGLSRAYGNYVASARSAATSLPQGVRGARPIGMATGGLVPGKGNKDTVPAMLTPGESVITKEATEKYAPILQAMNEGILPGFVKGVIDVGGKRVSLDVASVTSGAAIQERVNKALENQVATSEQILAIFEKVKDQAKVSATSLSKISETVFPAPKESSKYSARAAGIRGSVQSQLMDAGKEQEYLRALDARVGVEKGVNQYYDQQISLARQGGASEEQIKKLEEQRVAHLKSMTQIDRAHIAELTVAQKKSADAWSPDLWVAQTQAENQLSTILTSRQENGVEQNKNTQLYLAELRKSDASQDVIESITSKVTRGLALTEQELQVQAKVLKKMLASTKTMASTTTMFGAYASGVVGAAEARAASSNAPYVRDVAKAQAKATAIKTIDSMEDQLLISSPSEAAAQIGDNIDEGVAAGIKRSASKPISAAATMAKQVLKETDDVVKKATRSASRPSGPAGMSTQEITAQASAQARAERKLRGPVVRQGTLSPISFRAGEETTRVQNIGNAQEMAIKENINRSHNQAIIENTSRTKSVSAELAKQPSSIKKFGGSLVKGSGKVTGAMFAMDGLVFAASMMNNSMGEFAQKIMPVVFGLSALRGILPLLMNPIGALIAGFAALGAGLLFLKSKYDQSIESQIKYSLALDGSAKTLDNFAKELGRTSPIEKFNQMLSGMTIKKQEKSLTRGQEILESEMGKKFVEESKQLKPEERLASLQNQINRLLAFEIFTPQDAIDVSRAMGMALNDPYISNQLINGIYENLGKNQKVLGSAFESVFQNTLRDVEDSVNSYRSSLQNMASLDSTDSSNFPLTPDYDPSQMLGMGTSVSAESSDAIKEGTENIQKYILADNERAAAVATSLNNMQKISEAQAYLNMQYRNGSITLEEYTKKTSTLSIAKESIVQVFTSLRKEVNTSSATISEDLKTTSLAMGMLEEDFAKIEDQVRATEEILSGAFKDIDIQPISDALQIGLLTGDITSGEVAGLISAASGGLKGTVELLLEMPGSEGSVGEILDLINLLANSPSGIKTDIVTKFETGGYTLDDINMLVVAASRFAGLPQVTEQAYRFSIEGGSQEALTKAESFYNKVKEDPNVGVNINTDQVDLDSLLKVSRAWDKLGKEKDLNKKAVVELKDEFTSNAQKFSFTWDKLNSLPDIVKQAVLIELSVMAEVQLKMASVQDDINISGGGDAITRKLKQDLNNEISESVSNINNLFSTGEGTNTGVTGDDSKSGGSADKQKSALQEMISSLNETLRLYTDSKNITKKILNSKKAMEKFFKQMSFEGGVADNLRAMNLSETLVADLLSKGAKNANKIMKALGKRGLKNLDRVTTLGRAAQRQSEVEGKVNREEYKATAKTRLERDGRFTKEEIDQILKSEEDIELIATFPINKNKKKWRELKTALQQDAKIELTVEPKTDLEKFDEVNKAIQEGFDALEQKKRNDMADEFLSKNKMTVSAMEKQVETNDRLIDIQQDLVDKKQEEVDDYERVNDLIRQGIDDLQRQDEMRNRVAEGLTKELETMSKQEDKIRKTYDERIKALDKVASINDYIVNQQKQQIGLSQALSSGDIYAATAAAQEMRASSAQFASQQVRQGLQEGMENQVAGLRTSGGLTREQAEQQIADIKEQSYQASLLIRIEEDKIYANSLEIRRLSNEIYNINEDMIEPLQNKNKEYARILDYNRQNEAYAISELALAGLTREEWNRKAGELQASITPANNLNAALQGVAGSYWEVYRAAIAAANAARANLPATRTPEVLTTAQIYGMTTGQRFAAGGVVGSGTRDSVSAMLTPGEFVVRKAMVDKYGMPMLSALNQGSFEMPKYNVGNSAAGNMNVKPESTTSVVAPMYNNYSVNVSVSNANASPDEIANKVMFKMKQLQGQNIRSNRG